MKDYLDLREINGYSIQQATFYPAAGDAWGRGGEIRGCLVYIGLPSNPQFLGRQSEEAVAAVIARSEGPSGRNDEYLFMLEEGLERLGVGRKGADGHVRELVGRVRKLVGEERWEAVKRGMGREGGGGGEGDEEVEK